MAKIRCGNCGGTHDSVLGVKECYTNSATTDTPREARERRERLAQRDNEESAFRRHPQDPAGTPDWLRTDAAPAVRFGGRTDADWKTLAAEREAAQERAAYAAKADRDQQAQDAWDRSHAKRPTVTEDGMYLNPETGQIFKAQFNRASGDGRRLYAKALVVRTANGVTAKGLLDLGPEEAAGVDLSFEYVPGAIHYLRPEWRMTMEQAAIFGRLYGRCVRCGKVLTLEESIERAMGRICAGKL